MNKKLIAAFIAITLSTSTSAHATKLQNRTVAQPTIAILDTALDTSLPIFKDKILLEVCINQNSSCPNKLSEMEGPGSATLPTEILSRNGFAHGTEMASLAVNTNPNVKIIFIRIIGANPDGSRQITTDATLNLALDWVLKNKDRFNIQAVSMSQGHRNLGAVGTDYCTKTPITQSKIVSLNNVGVGVFFPAGNHRDYKRIDWPACIPESIAIGSTMPAESIASYSNYDEKLIDFYALGQNRVTTVGGKVINSGGTSGSTVIAATQWATIKSFKPQLTYAEIYQLISRTSKIVSSATIKNQKLINLQAALNG